MSEQAPRPAEHGRFLQKDSVAGRRVDFVQDSTIGTAQITLNATGDASNLDFGSFAVTFTFYIDESDVNSTTWDSAVAWNFAEFYIDAGSIANPDYLYRVGSAVSGTTAALRKKMLIDIIKHDMADLRTLGTQTWYYFCKNNDSSSHTIDIYSRSKYIITGDNYA